MPAAAVWVWACAAAAEVPESEAARVGADAAARHQRRGRRRCRVSMALDVLGGKAYMGHSDLEVKLVRKKSDFAQDLSVLRLVTITFLLTLTLDASFSFALPHPVPHSDATNYPTEGCSLRVHYEGRSSPQGR